MDSYDAKAEETDTQKPPVRAGWICLVIAWILFLIPIPGLGLIGWVLNFAAFIISIVVIVKGRVAAGVVQMVCVFIVSPLIYFIGLGILAHLLLPRPGFYRTWV
jgi:hypothetical protein